MKFGSAFRHRSVWLGLAMALVMLYHSLMPVRLPYYGLIQKYGFVGVDIFVFASGIGCYYSLDKDPDILRFLKRRMSRLGPVYLCFIIPWLLWKLSAGGFPVDAVVGNLLGLESFHSWTYHFNWYISALIVFYLLLPYMKWLTDSFWKIWGDLLAVLILILMAVPSWSASNYNMVIWARLPILYLGVMYGKLGKQGFALNLKTGFLHVLSAVAGCLLLYATRNWTDELLWNRGMNWYPFLFITPGCCMFVSFLCEYLIRWNPVKLLLRPVQLMGEYSFELYLVHILFFEQLRFTIYELFAQFSYVPDGYLWLALWLAVFILAFLLNRIARLMGHLVAGKVK